MQNRTQWSGGPVSVFLTVPNFCSAVCLRRGKSKVLVLTSQSTVGPQNCLSAACSRLISVESGDRSYREIWIIDAGEKKHAPNLHLFRSLRSEEGRGGGGWGVIGKSYPQECFPFAAAAVVCLCGLIPVTHWSAERGAAHPLCASILPQQSSQIGFTLTVHNLQKESNSAAVQKKVSRVSLTTLSSTQCLASKIFSHAGV